MPVSVRAAPFEPYAEVLAHQAAHFASAGAFGATAVFVGTMRDFNEGDAVRGMTLEHYPGMTEQHLEAICAETAARWTLLETLVIHRVGDIEPGEPIVLVAVWSAHRAEAFEACRALMEDLKSRAPFWKKERINEGTRWVSGNTAGYTGQES
jgi:molybdopterin synthase catalytic subunit